MIVKVKTEGKRIGELEDKLISRNGKKTFYKINPLELNIVIKAILDSGFEKFKIELEEDDELEIANSIHELKKMTYMEYLEWILEDEIKQLEKDKDIDKFFKSIKFEDKKGIIKSVYNSIINMSEEGKYCAQSRYINVMINKHLTIRIQL